MSSFYSCIFWLKQQVLQKKNVELRFLSWKHIQEVAMMDLRNKGAQDLPALVKEWNHLIVHSIHLYLSRFENLTIAFWSCKLFLDKLEVQSLSTKAPRLLINIQCVCSGKKIFWFVDEDHVTRFILKLEKITRRISYTLTWWNFEKVVLVYNFRVKVGLVHLRTSSCFLCKCLFGPRSLRFKTACRTPLVKFEWKGHNEHT